MAWPPVRARPAACEDHGSGAQLRELGGQLAHARGREIADPHPLGRPGLQTTRRAVSVLGGHGRPVRTDPQPELTRGEEHGVGRPLRTSTSKTTRSAHVWLPGAGEEDAADTWPWARPPASRGPRSARRICTLPKLVPVAPCTADACRARGTTATAPTTTRATRRRVHPGGPRSSGGLAPSDGADLLVVLGLISMSLRPSSMAVLSRQHKHRRPAFHRPFENLVPGTPAGVAAARSEAEVRTTRAHELVGRDRRSFASRSTRTGCPTTNTASRGAVTGPNTQSRSSTGRPGARAGRSRRPRTRPARYLFDSLCRPSTGVSVGLERAHSSPSLSTRPWRGSSRFAPLRASTSSRLVLRCCVRSCRCLRGGESP